MLGLFECESPISTVLQVKFANHVSEYGLSFGTQEEYNFRMNEYAKKDAYIEESNAEGNSYELGHNFMSTWTNWEYKRLLGYKKGKVAEDDDDKVIILDEINIPDAVDWRT